VVYSDGSDKVKTTLFRYWDSELISKFMRHRTHFWYGGWTHVNTIGKAFQLSEKEAWDALPPERRHEIFEKWALENFQVACSLIYVLPIGSEAVTDGLEISPNIEFAWFEETKKRILRAGVRTAIVLNALLEQREASRLRQGSGVALPVEDFSPVRTGFPSWAKNLLSNVVILVVILAVFVYVTKYYSGPSSASGTHRKASVTSSSAMDSSVPPAASIQMKDSKLR